MTIKELILKMRTPLNIEIRRNNWPVITCCSDNIEAVKDDILENEIDDWFIGCTTNKPYACFNYITEEEENESMV